MLLFMHHGLCQSSRKSQREENTELPIYHETALLPRDYKPSGRGSRSSCLQQINDRYLKSPSDRDLDNERGRST